MLTKRTKYLLKLMRGWSSADVARYYNTTESTVHRHTYQLKTPTETKEVKPLFSTEHYMNLCWLKLYINEGIYRR